MSLPLPPNLNTLWAETFVAELALAGVRMACVAPGSRSTPLTLALAKHPEIRVLTVLDERSCAFIALGVGKATGMPAVALCTSGTAAANFHPAVLEASHGEVPLIVLTADRPPEARDTGAAQTVDQLKLYGAAVRWFFEVGTPAQRDAGLRQLRGLAARAVYVATRAPAGPVHLNFPFHKPLEPTPVPGDISPEFEKTSAFAMRGTPGRPYAQGTHAAPRAAPHVLRRLADQVRAAPKGLILCGPMTFAADGSGTPWQEFPAAVAALSRRTGYPILAEPPSQLRDGPHDQTHVIAHAEALLRTEGFRRRLTPQLVLRFGGMPTGKHQEILLEEHPECPVLVVNPGGTWLEPTHHPAEVMAADPGAFCSDLAEALPEGRAGDEDWLRQFVEADAIAAEALGAAFSAPAPGGLGDGWNEPRVIREVAALLPEGALQFTGSSMPVRDLEAFSPKSNRMVRHLVNRGVNGIDGTISSALGAAAAYGRPAVLISGDVTLLHDANGLLAAKTNGLSLTIVLINNDGGGIFEFLPISTFGQPYEKHFGTPHGTDFGSLCRGYGAVHLLPADWAQFRAEVRRSLTHPGVRVIEVRTDRRINREQHRVLWQAVASRLTEAGLA
jgi:2-succinyl-5-enolpyruvyl-6-hydroxy-3-cyclohexene-1-carboxylate synthase